MPVADESGRLFRIIGVARDITEAKAALGALRESEERFRQLADSIRGVFWMTDVDKTELLYISPSYETTWGRSRESLRASPASWLEAIHPDDRERVEADLPSQRERPWETTYRIVRPDGVERWIRDRSFPVRNERGAVHRIAGIAEDITAAVETEERLRQSQKIEALGALAAGVAHDFNNLLSVILSYSTLMRDAFDEADPMREDVEEIRKAGQRGSELTRQLLAFSRRQILSPRVFDLHECVRGMDRMLRRVLAGSVELTVIHEAGVAAVRADPGQVELVLLNLVVNARDAMPRGGSLTIKIRNVEVDRDAGLAMSAAPGAYVRLSVEDNGIGMDKATRARIFEPFFTTKELGRGTGLGLPTVLGIVRQSGGAVTVESAPGKGTAFEVYLPRVGAPVGPWSAPPGAAGSAQGTETVLVVEDEEHVRALVRTILRRAGYAVLDAQSPGDALLVCENHRGPIHLVLTDIVMPHLRGDQLVARVTHMRPEAKFLYMSGHPGTVAEEGALGAPVIPKPFTPDGLCRAIRMALDEE